MKAKKKITVILCVITGMILLCVGLYYAVNLVYSKTEVPDGLSAQETVEQYFEYWNAGNNKGRYLISCDRRASEDTAWYESLSPAYLFDNIRITDIDQLELVPDYPYIAECADYIVFQVNFTKSDTGNDSWSGFAFVGVCRETEDSPWRIDSMFTGW